jgi:hypothetical protein
MRRVRTPSFGKGALNVAATTTEAGFVHLAFRLFERHGCRIVV